METNTTGERYTVFSILNLLLLILYCVIAVLGIVGNGLVIWFVAFRMRKTVNSVWFLSLAVADLAFSLFLALRVIFMFFGFYWQLGTIMCKVNFLALYLNLSASIFQITVISIDRYICLVFPVWCQNHRTMKLAVKVVLVIWIGSLLFCICYVFLVPRLFSLKHMKCYFGPSMQKVEVLLEFIVLFVLPFTIIIFCNLVIFSRIRRNRRSTSTKPFKVTAAVVISFFICWFPFHLFSLMNVYQEYYMTDGNSWLGVGLVISLLLAYSNSCINPLLYVFIGQDFKEKFCIAIKSAFEKAFADETIVGDSERHRMDRRFIATPAAVLSSIWIPLMSSGVMEGPKPCIGHQTAEEQSTAGM